jgi:hypothetical protein
MTKATPPKQYPQPKTQKPGMQSIKPPIRLPLLSIPRHIIPCTTHRQDSGQKHPKAPNKRFSTTFLESRKLPIRRQCGGSLIPGIAVETTKDLSEAARRTVEMNEDASDALVVTTIYLLI